jgi:SPOR domain
MSVSGQPAGAEARLDEYVRRLRAVGPRETSAEDDVVELARKLAPARSSPNAQGLPTPGWTDTEQVQPFEAAATAPSFGPDETSGMASINLEASQSSTLAVPDLHNARDANRATQRRSGGWIFKAASIAPAAGAALLGAGLVIVVFGPKAGSHGPPKQPPVAASIQVPAKTAQGSGETVATLEDADAIPVTDVAPIRVVHSETRPIDLPTGAQPGTAPSIPPQAGPPVSASVAAALAAASPPPASQSPEASPEHATSAAAALVDPPATSPTLGTGHAAQLADALKQPNQPASAENKASTAARPMPGTSTGSPVSSPVAAASVAASLAAAAPPDARAPSVMTTSEAAQPVDAPRGPDQNAFAAESKAADAAQPTRGTSAGPPVSSPVAAAPVAAPPSAASQSPDVNPEHAAAAAGDATAARSATKTGEAAEPGDVPRERNQPAPAIESKAAATAQSTASQPNSATVEAGRPADEQQRPAKAASSAESKAAAVARLATPRLNLRARLSRRPARIMLAKPQAAAPSAAADAGSQPLHPAAPTTPQSPAPPPAAPPMAAPQAGDPVGHAFGAVAGALGVAENQNAASKSGNWALQFMAPKSEAEAQANASRLNARFARRLNGATIGVQKTEVNGETVYAVRVPGLSKADAAALCDRMKGRDCSAVK